jgi:hypothetical protein
MRPPDLSLHGTGRAERLSLRLLLTDVSFALRSGGNGDTPIST